MGVDGVCSLHPSSSMLMNLDHMITVALKGIKFIPSPDLMFEVTAEGATVCGEMAFCRKKNL